MLRSPQIRFSEVHWIATPIELILHFVLLYTGIMLLHREFRETSIVNKRES